MSDFYYVKSRNGVILDKYLAVEGYKCTPDQRQDKDSYRDGEGVLHRNVLGNVATTLELTTIDGMSMTDMQAFMNALRTGMTNDAERKVVLTYWNDERMSYCTDTFYMPDMTFEHRNVDPTTNTPIYKSVTFKFIGYGAAR